MRFSHFLLLGSCQFALAVSRWHGAATPNRVAASPFVTYRSVGRVGVSSVDDIVMFCLHATPATSRGLDLPSSMYPIVEG